MTQQAVRYQCIQVALEMGFTDSVVDMLVAAAMIAQYIEFAKLPSDGAMEPPEEDDADDKQQDSYAQVQQLLQGHTRREPVVLPVPC